MVRAKRNAQSAKQRTFPNTIMTMTHTMLTTVAIDMPIAQMLGRGAVRCGGHAERGHTHMRMFVHPSPTASLCSAQTASAWARISASMASAMPSASVAFVAFIPSMPGGVPGGSMAAMDSA